MINVQLILHWENDGKEDAAFHKFVKMPALPPVGCRIYIEDGGEGSIGIVEVTSVWWFEDNPGHYQVELEAMQTYEEERADVIEWMRSLGWTNENETSCHDVSPGDSTETEERPRS